MLDVYRAIRGHYFCPWIPFIFLFVVIIFIVSFIGQDGDRYIFLAISLPQNLLTSVFFLNIRFHTQLSLRHMSVKISPCHHLCSCRPNKPSNSPLHPASFYRPLSGICLISHTLFRTSTVNNDILMENVITHTHIRTHTCMCVCAWKERLNCS